MSIPDALDMSDELRSDVVEALRMSLARASAQDLGVTPAAANWRKMQDWLVEVSTTRPGQPIPPLPITGRELRSLQAQIDEVVRRRLAETEPEAMTKPERA